MEEIGNSPREGGKTGKKAWRMTLFSPCPESGTIKPGHRNSVSMVQPWPWGMGSPASEDIPHGWQPAWPVSPQPHNGSDPWREQGLAVAMGWVAEGVTKQAGLVRVVSHCQLSLPGWDRHSHLASHWLHWEHQATSRQEKTSLFPRSSPLAWGAGGVALVHARSLSPSPAGQIRHGSGSGEAPSLVQTLEGPHPTPCQRVQTFGGCCVPLRAGRPQCQCSWHAVCTQALCTHQHHMATVSGATSRVWTRMGKQLCLP